jgi:hypothetical protein
LEEPVSAKNSPNKSLNISRLSGDLFYRAFSMPPSGISTLPPTPPREALSLEELLQEAIEDRLPASEPSFRITALVAPVVTAPKVKHPSFAPADFPSITETADFDIGVEHIQEAMRCSCLHIGGICTAKTPELHYVVEWRTGSVFALEEVEDVDSSFVEIEKGGRPRLYEGWCKGGVKSDLSDTERLSCVEGWQEEVAREEKTKTSEEMHRQKDEAGDWRVDWDMMRWNGPGWYGTGYRMF